MRIFLLLLLIYSLSYGDQIDDNKYSIRLGYGIADLNDLQDILLGHETDVSIDTSLINLDVGYRMFHNVNKWPLDIYAKGSITYFNEKGVINYITNEKSKDFFEMTLYIKAYYNINFSDNRIRLGLGEGLSFAGEVPVSEVYDARHYDGSEGDTSKILNYLDLSVDIDIGRLFSIEMLRDTYVGYTIKHRSGIYGFFHGVHGGSNYKMITLEKNF